ncbi:MAG TPA: PilZ domain-containing protein [Polyangiaceae bacterium]
MSDPVTLARTARESLARGLNALQADPNVPQQLVELAAPIAQAMGALHQIERSGGTQVAPHAQNALANVQGALAQLQSAPQQHAAVSAAMEAVAGALSSVHALSRSAPVAPPPAAAPQQQAYAPPAQSFAQPQYAQQPAQQYAPPQPQYPAQQAQYAQAPAAQASQAHPRTAPVAAVPQQPAPAAARPQQPQAAPSSDAIAAELGAHSPSNFYKGLSGNDIVDHGGLFVSTYKLPKLGTHVRLRVSLPGGYEFEANALVKWRREPSDASTDAPPGFGAQFTDITPEARQLVYRYVRNREPMFHDDL